MHCTLALVPTWMVPLAGNNAHTMWKRLRICKSSRHYLRKEGTHSRILKTSCTTTGCGFYETHGGNKHALLFIIKYSTFSITHICEYDRYTYCFSCRYSCDYPAHYKVWNPSILCLTGRLLYCRSQYRVACFRSAHDQQGRFWKHIEKPRS